MAVIGGNPSLSANSGHGWTANLEYTPSEQLTLSASYWNSVIHNRITYLTIPFTLNHEARFPGRVIRADPTAQDLELGVPGSLISVDISPGNYGELEADGIDFAFKSSWDTKIGRLAPRLAATWNHSFKTTISGLQPVERVGIGSDEGTIPRWRALASVGLEQRSWSFLSTVRFTSSYDDALLGVKNGRSVGASIQLDAQASIELGAFTTRAALEGLTLTAGAINLFDAEPEYSEVFGADGYDGTQADLRQRFWYVAIAKTF
jgi:outer membrane receptor protein involved in Fe transport